MKRVLQTSIASMTKLTKRTGTLVLRLLAVGATISAVIVMATSRERASFFALSLEVKYDQLLMFKYFLIANAVISVYGFLVVFLPKESLLWKLVVVLDFVSTLTLTSCVSAAIAVAEVGKRGNLYAGWLPICGQVPKFCDQITAALVAGFIALVLYIVLLLYSIHAVMDPFLLQKS